jgi:hypothetical protein
VKGNGWLDSPIPLLGAGLLVLLVWGYDRYKRMNWIGYTDLEIEVEVTDATSGKPIPGAHIEVQSWGTMEDGDDEERKFDLYANANGVVHQEFGKTKCSGCLSGLRFTDTFHVYRPWWYFQITAAGYEPSDPIDLHLSGNRWKAKRTGGGRSKLFVDVSLQRAP